MAGMHSDPNGTAPMPPLKPAREVPLSADEAAADPTVLEFDGRMNVSDDDTGSDPYNRTGRFRRVIR